MNLRICWAVKGPPVGSFTTGNSSAAFEEANKIEQPLSQRYEAIGLQTHPPEDAAP